MSDVIERAEGVLRYPDTRIGHGLVRDLVAEVKRLRGLVNDVVEVACWLASTETDTTAEPDILGGDCSGHSLCGCSECVPKALVDMRQKGTT